MFYKFLNILKEGLLFVNKILIQRMTIFQKSRSSYESPLALTKFPLKVIKSVIKVICFSTISEISLDKFKRIWSMKRRERESVRGERANGS